MQSITKFIFIQGSFIIFLYYKISFNNGKLLRIKFLI
uniref:Uncharacterized protein n=1 Tax=Spyridia filamentosa TaxID=196632 RepID=A0A1Z1MK02_SPYFI|nr:hypothetical protein [Spyridia filamentosa]ARW66219.1 hypothetical protein [Spyridia filamentosa]